MNKKLLLQDLVDQLAEAGDIKKKDAEEFLRALFKTSEDALFAGEMVKIPGLGSFKLIPVDARKSVNVSTGEEIEIKAHFKLSFTPDNELKGLVNKPYAHLDPVELDVAIENSVKATENKVETHKSKSPKKNENFILQNDAPAEKTTSKTSKEPYSSIMESSPKPKSGNWMWFVFFAIILGLGIWSWISNETQKKEDRIKLQNILLADSILASAQPKDTLSSILDSTANTSIDTLSKQAVVVIKKTEEKTSQSEDLLASVVMTSGQRLTAIAQKYYGHKAFWVYIYLANKEVIKNPDVISAGTVIRIPKPDPKLINANNPTLIAKAKALQAQILDR